MDIFALQRFLLLSNLLPSPLLASTLSTSAASNPEHPVVAMPFPLEGLLRAVVSYMEVFLELASVLCVTIGLFKTLQLALKRLRHRHHRPSFPLGEIRLQFGVWLLLALEFQLGADILATTIAPTFESLGKLGAIALIRTFLNYFLNKELVEEYRLIGVERSRQED